MASLSHLSIGQKSWSLVTGDPAILNYKNMTFFEPVGLSFLCGVIHNQFKVAEKVILQLNPETMNYLERINVFSFLENEYQNRLDSNYGCDFTGTFIEICFRTDVTRTPDIEDNDWPF